MPPKISFLTKIKNFIFRFKWWLGAVLVVLVVVGLVIKSKSKSTYQFIPVTEGPITELVSVTGNTTPTNSVSLGFSSSGTIANIYSAVGSPVSKGALLASLNNADISAQLKQAQANVDVETAKLNSLKSGATPQDIAVSQTAVDSANQELDNYYASINDIATDAYAKASDAVGTQLGGMFTNNQLNIPNVDSQSYISANNKDSAALVALNSWQQKLSVISDSSSDTDLDTLLQNSLTYLNTVSDLLQDMSALLNGNNININSTTLSADKAEVSTGVAEVNLASKNLNIVSQNIASQKLAVAQAQAALALKQAGSTENDIKAQEASVESAQANVASIQAKFTDSEIVAPMNGVVTQFDAKIGQTAAPGTTLVSIISNGNFEVDADVPETDIGKIAAGNPVNMTFDAFPGENFAGNVFYIDPAETINQGVIDYKIKVSFAKPDPRMKSGLTANLDIQTAHKDSVLTLPEYAILQTDAGTFVNTLVGKTVKQNPVTLGIQDQNGNVEITSGVVVGEEVINVGLK